MRSLRIAGLVAALASLIASGRIWSAALTPATPVVLPAPEPQRLFVSPAVVVAPPVRVAPVRKPRHEVRVPLVQAAAAPPRHVSIGPPLPLVPRPTKSPSTTAPSTPPPEPKHAPPPHVISPAPVVVHPTPTPQTPVAAPPPAPQAPVAAPAASQPAGSDDSLTPASAPPPAPAPSDETPPPPPPPPPPSNPPSPPAQQPAPDDQTLPARPGWGNGDENHDHTGPPGAQDGHGH